MTISLKANAAGTQGEVLLNGTPVQTFNQNTLQVSGNVLAGAAQSADPAALTRKDYVDGPAFYAWQNAAQSYVNGANKVNLQAKLFDTANAFNTTLSRFQPQVAGYYQLTGLVSNNLAANNQSSIVFIQKNGVTVVNGPVALGDPFNATQAGVAALVYMNGTTDYVDMNIYCAPATGAATQSQTFFSGFLARGA